MRDFCAELAGHPFFANVQFTNNRMQHHQVVAQTILVELAAGPTNVKNASLRRLYKEQADFDRNSDVGRRVRRIYDFLGRCFPDKTLELRRGYVVSLYLLASRFLRIQSLDGLEPAFRKFSLNFDHRRRTELDNLDMIKFGERLSHSSDGEDSIRFRDEILMSAFERFVSSFSKQSKESSPVKVEIGATP
jgi:hypothetical protein